ncbi:hypothetical protein [Pseudomonas sp. NA-150]|uniref:hypothetical protein n=1 Tax=Pseudomonas sp. NA-150 TaxID=3367525 RepID=UPI0037C9B67D
MCNKHTLASVNRYKSRKPKELNAPAIPLADPIDGLLTLEDLEQTIVVTLTVWDEALPGDTYQLVWNGISVGLIKTVGENEGPGDSLTLDIPEALLRFDGTYQVAYRAASTDGGQENTSNSTPVIVDRTAPGGSLLAAMKFPAAINDGVLTSAELTAMGDVLTAEVPGYTGIAWGDHIQTFWGGKPGPDHNVDELEVGQDRVMIEFTRAFLEGIGDVTEPVYYTVTDRAGNKSIDSLENRFRLFLRPIPEDFPAPMCAQADDGMIDDADARAVVAVDIPQYPDSLAGDKVTLYWGTTPLPEADVLPDDDTEDPMFSINVRYSTIARSGDGIVALRYEVKRNGILIGSSLELAVNVNLELPGPPDPNPETPENENLDRPIIRGTSSNPNNEDNVIDEDDFLLEAKAIIGWKDEFVISDVIHLFWGSQATPVDFPIKATDLNRDLTLTIPNTLMADEGTGEDIKVYYTVTHAGNPNTSRSFPQSVSVSSEGDLPGGVDGLLAPVFTRANDNNAISPILSPDGTPIFITPYENIEKYPRVTLVFHGYNAANGNTPVPGASVEETHTLDEGEIINGYSFRIPDNKLRLICTGRAEAYYRVEGPSGPVNSRTAPVLIRMAIPGVGC